MDKKEWLNTAVFYEVYPTSFYDSNDDGTGDLKGITEKLGYISSLGANGLWLNPFYRSPFRDGGYDVEDYYSVDPRFGTLDDIKELFNKAHSLDIKVIVDLVVGHTSDKCKWFVESAKPERNEFSDYYIWTDSVWEDTADLKGVIGGAERDGNYVVNFFAMQPALNFGFNNCTKSWQKKYTDSCFEKMHSRVLDIMRFWLLLGADGFRVDMAGSLIKGDDEDYSANCWLWKRLIGEIEKDYPNAIFVSEWSRPEISLNRAGFDADFLIHINESDKSYTSLFRTEREVSAFHRSEGESFFRKGSRAKPDIFQDRLTALLNARLEGFLSIPTGNHDLSRLSENRDDSDLCAIFAFLLTIPSVPFIYYGDEIALKGVNGLSKDGGYDRTPARTPMKWNSDKGYGFSTADKTYLPLGREGSTVESRQKESNGLWQQVQRLISLRKTEPALRADAGLEFLKGLPDGVMGYKRINALNTITVYVSAQGATDVFKTPKHELICSHNAIFDDTGLHFSDCGYAILKKTL